MSGRITVGVDMDRDGKQPSKINLRAPDEGWLVQLTTVDALQLVTDILTAIQNNGLLAEALP
jgi:glycine cleavage system H lipoate-binding protein